MGAGTFDDVANINPHPEFDPLVRRNERIALDHCALNFDSASQRFHGADEKHKETVSGRPDDPAMVLSDLGFDQLGMVSVQLSESAFVINTYEAAITGHIRHQDRHKPAFDVLTGHSFHSTAGSKHFRPSACRSHNNLGRNGEGPLRCPTIAAVPPPNSPRQRRRRALLRRAGDRCE
jgi:hypothetical protein